jgi:hypothetical protein
MRNFLILAVAASFAVACAGRTEDDMGAAPEQGEPTVTATDTSAAVHTDSTMGQLPSDTDTSYVEQDTTAVDETFGVDSVGAQGEVQTGDTTAADTWTDTTAAESPMDTTATETWDTTADTTEQQ